jgi:hypothetical protein
MNHSRLCSGEDTCCLSMPFYRLILFKILYNSRKLRITAIFHFSIIWFKYDAGL